MSPIPIERAKAAFDDLAAIESFRPTAHSRARPRVSVGTIVEVEDGDQGHTIFLAPVGAGVELTMPDGDGFLTVVTPASPLGKAIIGRGVGDTVEVCARGEPRE